MVAAAKQSGLTPSLIAAEAFLESFGDPKAQSPAGPRGIMQFSQATARAAGLKVVLATRYRTLSERKKVIVKGKTVTRVVTHKTPYEVIVRDDRYLHFEYPMANAHSPSTSSTSD